MRIVIDANIFVSAAISPHGACGKVLRAILENPDEFELILTEQMIEETIASLNKPRITRYLKPGYDPESWMKDISSLSTVGTSPIAAVSGYPSITVPAGFIQGLPVGLSFFWEGLQRVDLAEVGLLL